MIQLWVSGSKIQVYWSIDLLEHVNGEAIIPAKDAQVSESMTD